jgi:hypothetical protein
VTDPLPPGVGKYVADGNYDATPDEVLRECGLDESRREQVEHYLAVTRYGMFNDRERVHAARSSGGRGPPSHS